MTMNSIPRFANIVEMAGIEITAVSTLTTLATGNTDGTFIDMLSIVTTDSAATALELWIEDDSANVFQIATVPVPAGSGTDGTNNAVNGFNATNIPFLPANAFSNKVLHLKAGWFLKCKVESLTATRSVTCVAGIRDY